MSFFKNIFSLINPNGPVNNIGLIKDAFKANRNIYADKDINLGGLI